MTENTQQIKERNHNVINFLSKIMTAKKEISSYYNTQEKKVHVLLTTTNGVKRTYAFDFIPLEHREEKQGLMISFYIADECKVNLYDFEKYYFSSDLYKLVNIEIELQDYAVKAMLKHF